MRWVLLLLWMGSLTPLAYSDLVNSKKLRHSLVYSEVSPSGRFVFGRKGRDTYGLLDLQFNWMRTIPVETTQAHAVFSKTGRYVFILDEINEQGVIYELPSFRKIKTITDVSVESRFSDLDDYFIQKKGSDKKWKVLSLFTGGPSIEIEGEIANVQGDFIVSHTEQEMSLLRLSDFQLNKLKLRNKVLDIKISPYGKLIWIKEFENNFLYDFETKKIIQLNQKIKDFFWIDHESFIYQFDSGSFFLSNIISKKKQKLNFKGKVLYSEVSPQNKVLVAQTTRGWGVFDFIKRKLHFFNKKEIPAIENPIIRFSEKEDRFFIYFDFYSHSKFYEISMNDFSFIETDPFIYFEQLYFYQNQVLMTTGSEGKLYLLFDKKEKLTKKGIPKKKKTSLSVNDFLNNYCDVPYDSQIWNQASLDYDLKVGMLSDDQASFLFSKFQKNFDPRKDGVFLKSLLEQGFFTEKEYRSRWFFILTRISNDYPWFAYDIFQSHFQYFLNLLNSFDGEEFSDKDLCVSYSEMEAYFNSDTQDIESLLFRESFHNMNFNDQYKNFFFWDLFHLNKKNYLKEDDLKEILNLKSVRKKFKISNKDLNEDEVFYPLISEMRKSFLSKNDRFNLSENCKLKKLSTQLSSEMEEEILKSIQDFQNSLPLISEKDELIRLKSQRDDGLFHKKSEPILSSIERKQDELSKSAAKNIIRSSLSSFEDLHLHCSGERKQNVDFRFGSYQESLSCISSSGVREEQITLDPTGGDLTLSVCLRWEKAEVYSDQWCWTKSLVFNEQIKKNHYLSSSHREESFLCKKVNERKWSHQENKKEKEPWSLER